jgi:ssDNA-binding Zn-finger/Zn-ribbon topoisomerase 1
MTEYPPEMAPKCPKCAKLMVERKGTYGPFFGCRSYPDCKGVVTMDEFKHNHF